MGEAIQTRAVRYSQARIAVVSFSVIAGSEQEAMNSVPYKSGAVYPTDGMLYARPPVASRAYNSVGLWEVEVTFESISNSHDLLSTLQPGEFGISWEPGLEQVPFNIDGDGIYVANTAGSVFDPAPTRPKGTVYLSITQFEVPNSAHWKRYLETTNTRPIEVFTGAGVEELKEDEILCTQIRPNAMWKMRDRNTTAPLMLVTYEFEIRYGGHHLSTINKGDSGWFMGPPPGWDPSQGTFPQPTLQRGTFYNGAGYQLFDILLDLDGTPYAKDQGIRCGKAADKTYDAVPAPDQYHADASRAKAIYGPNSPITGTSESKKHTQIGWALNFRRFTSVDMTEVLDPASA